MTEFCIATKNITKIFGKESAVKDLSLHIRKNTVYGLLGPNGAGKSTFLKMLTGIIQPTSGEILITGKPWQRSDLTKIGSLIEQPAIYENLTAVENLEVFTRLLQLPTSRIQEVLEQVSLTKTGNKRVGQFSLGMKQRLGIALALLNKPEIIILDEPTNGLDPLGIQDLREMIRAFPKQGMTVILSSHILTEVEQVADDIGIISQGKLGFEGPNAPEQDLESLFMEIVRKHQREEGRN